ADIMGIPEEDRADVFRWTDLIGRGEDPQQDISRADHTEALASLFEYAKRLGEEKRRNPAGDVWSILSTVTIEDDDGRLASLSPLELDQFFMILAIAGSETTRNAISAGLVALLENPDQMELLRSDPAGMPGAAEEMLRWATPVTVHMRT